MGLRGGSRVEQVSPADDVQIRAASAPMPEKRHPISR
jgi:hypothetical protein